MFILSFLRAIKFSFQDIVRNFWLSLVTVIILLLALFLVNILITVQIITKSAVDSIKEKIDINLDIKGAAEDNEINALKAQISGLDKVKNVTFVSKADALEKFKENHKNDPQILQALRELNKNPLTPTLVIKPNDVAQYDELINDLNKINSTIIESRNFDNPKVMLEKINKIATKINEVGLIVNILFIIITILVVYNSIRVTIYTHQKEIKIMRLVGASNWFIKAPFLISSLLYTLFGLITIIAIYYPFLSLLQPYLETFFTGYNFNLLTYFNQNFFLIFGLQFIAAAVVNSLASFIAVRKYSRI